MTAPERLLYGQLNTINENLCSATAAMAELLLRVVREPGVSGVDRTELRTIGRRLVSAGGDLTGLGVEIGVVADKIDGAQ